MIGFEDEKILLKRIADDDREAFRILYTRHLDNLHRYIFPFAKSKEATEEIMQNVFVKLWERRKALPEISSLKSYLYCCAKNLLIDEIRKNKAGAKVLAELRPSTDTSSEKADSKLIYDQYFQITQNAIDLLPKKRKQIVELRTREKFTFEQISQRLSISKSAVKKNFYTGILFVRNHLKKFGELDV